ncbi:MAG: hypothetical protein AAF907_15830, partial [Planctomycetota bacterium]
MTIRLAVAATLFAAPGLPAHAQRGPFGDGGGLFENEGFREEVGLTDEQLEKLRELQEAASEGIDRRSIGEMFRSAQTDEERQELREKVGEMFRESQRKFDEQSAEILTDKQRERYEQIRLRSRGVSGIIDSDETAKQFDLSDDQREAMRKIRDEAITELR